MSKSQLRKELRPDVATAQRLYPLILKRLEEYEAFYDAQSEDTPQEIFDAEYKKMETYLSELTGKDLSEVWLWEWWEGDGIEAFAFELALPEAQKHEHLTREDLTEVVRILNDMAFPSENDFQRQFEDFTLGYYWRFLYLNFPKYDQKFFEVKKDASGNYISPTVEEIVEKIW